MNEQQCIKCSKSYPRTEEFFNKAPSNRDGLSNRCKLCTKEYNRLRQAAKPKKRVIRDSNWVAKVCPGCGIEKGRDDYHNNKALRDGKGTRCKLCSNASTEEWRKREESKIKIRASGRQWNANNPDKVRQGKKNYRERHPERSKAQVQKCYDENYETKYKFTIWRRTLKVKYGLTEEKYYEMLEEQDFKCAICGNPETDTRRGQFCVDHCHDTGIVRGLLCFSCNVTLGNMNDRIDLLERAIEYLKKFPKTDWLSDLAA